MWDLLLQFLLPFLIASLVVIAVTVIAEKFGTKVGGILGTVPSTIVVAFVFIAINRGTTFSSDASSMVPAEMSINLVFLFLFSLLSIHGMFGSLIISLVVWSILSSILLFLGPIPIMASVLIYYFTIIAIFIVMEKIAGMRSRGSVRVNYTAGRIAFRGLFAGLVIGTTVILSNVGEAISGIFSVFPAIFLSTMLITLKEHGSSFSVGMGKSMLLGSQTVVLYAVSVHFLYPIMGILLGTLVAYVISMVNVGILLLVRRSIS